jgi:hypothetical protein
LGRRTRIFCWVFRVSPRSTSQRAAALRLTSLLLLTPLRMLPPPLLLMR